MPGSVKDSHFSYAGMWNCVDWGGGVVTTGFVIVSQSMTSTGIYII